MSLRPSLLFVLLAVGSTGCAGFGYVGSARDVAPETLLEEPGWVGVSDVPLFRQRADHDCGTTALAMVLRYWNADLDVDHLLVRAEDERVSAAELRRLAREAGFSAFVVEGTVEDLVHEIEAGRPVVVGTAKPTATGSVAHYEVVVGFHPDSERIVTLDPAEGWRANSYAGFLKEWLPTGSVLIVVLPLAPQPPASSPAAERASRRQRHRS